MKKNNIKKRLAALRSGLMLSLCVISPFSIFKADNDATPTTYGSYSTNQYYNGNTNGLTGSRSDYPMTVLTYSLNGTYNGRFTIYWKYWRSGTAYSDTLQAIELMIPINCYVEAISDSSCTIAFKNQSEVAILLQSKAINDEIEITGISNYNMTKITDGTASQLDHLNSMIDQLFVNSGTILTRLNTLVSQTDGVETGLTNINNNVLSILNEIQDYFTDNNGVTVNIGDIILQFNEFNANLQLQLGILNDLKSALQDIDNKIDTITWSNIDYKGLTNDFSTFTTIPYNGYNLNNSTYIAFNNISFWASGYKQRRIYKINVPTNTTKNQQVLLYGGYSNGNIVQINQSDILFIQYSRASLQVYFEISDDSPLWNGSVYLSIKLPGSQLYDSPTPTLSYIDSNDIEYWQLLNIFNQYKYKIEIINKLNTLTPINYNSKLNDIITAINNIEINYNVSNDIETNIETSLEAINDIDVVIENNIDVFNDNKDNVFYALDYFEDTGITRIDNAVNFLYDHIFVDDLRNLYTTYLWYSLFGILIVILLG